VSNQVSRYALYSVCIKQSHHVLSLNPDIFAYSFRNFAPNKLSLRRDCHTTRSPPLTQRGSPCCPDVYSTAQHQLELSHTYVVCVSNCWDAGVEWGGRRSTDFCGVARFENLHPAPVCMDVCDASAPTLLAFGVQDVYPSQVAARWIWTFWLQK
jgi:hypothetical protein